MNKLNFSGFTLVEVMLATVILGIIGMSVAMGFTTLFQTKSQFITESQVHNIQNAISVYLYNKTSCTSELSGKALPGATWSNLSLTKYKGFGDFVEVLQTGTDFGKMEIETLSIRRKPESLSESFNNGVEQYRIYIIQIKLQFKLTHLVTKLLSPFYIELPIFSKSPYTQIDSCYEGVKLPYFCATLGLSYNSATNSCTPQYRCLLRGFYSTVYCPESNECEASTSSRRNPVTNSYSCPAGVSPVQIGLYTDNYSERCGKKCTRTVQRRVRSYLCMDCN